MERYSVFVVTYKVNEPEKTLIIKNSPEEKKLSKNYIQDFITLRNRKLNYIDSHIMERPQATFTYFLADERKNGGSYVAVTGNVRQIDLVNNLIILTNKEKINILDLIGISGI